MLNIKKYTKTLKKKNEISMNFIELIKNKNKLIKLP